MSGGSLTASPLGQSNTGHQILSAILATLLTCSSQVWSISTPRDIEAGLHFYRDLLGFAETFRTPLDGVPEHVELALSGFTIGLGTVEAASRVHGVEAAPGSPAMVLVVWTDDVDGACQDLAAAGVPVLQSPHDAGNNNRSALLRDPDGNLVEIVAKVS